MRSPDTPRSPYYAAGDGDTPYYEAMVADKPWIECHTALLRWWWYVAHNASFDRRVLPELPGGGSLYHEVVATPVATGINTQYMALYKSRKLSVQTPPVHHHRARRFNFTAAFAD